MLRQRRSRLATVLAARGAPARRRDQPRRPFGGTELGNELCTAGRCAALAWQLRVGARTVAALQNAPLPAGASVTSLVGPYDEIVRPQPQASHLDGASNIVLNEVCAADPSEHGLILGDPAGSAAFGRSIERFTAGIVDPNRWVTSEPPLPAYARP